MSEEIYAGIDLGTTNTLACFLRKGKLRLAKFPGSGKLIPSVLYVDERKKVYVGDIAKKRMSLDPQNGIRSSKTDMGNAAKIWNCHGLTFTPTEVATEILKAVRQAVIKAMKCDDDAVVRAVITVPAYFNSNQRDETKKAGQAAGIEVLQIITEPMAAAVAAGQDLELDKKILVADLGGGTFDLSVLEADNLHHTYRALDIDGDRHLGGDDFDRRLQNHFIQTIKKDCGVDLSSAEASGFELNSYYSVLHSIRDAAETAKTELSEQEETAVMIPELFQYGAETYSFEETLTRNQFDAICQPLYDKIFTRVRRFISQSQKFTPADIATIVLAGGSCYIPYIQAEMGQIFQQPIDTQMDLTTIVATGACYVAESLRGGMETECEQTVVIEDIIAHSLGVQADENGKAVLSKILEKGDVYPCEKTRHYTTTRDFQTVIPIDIYEAGSDCEDKKDIDNHDFYGSMELTDIPAERAGKVDINVTFSYDQSGCLMVTAKDEESGISKQITIRKGEKQKTSRTTAVSADMVVLLDTSGSMSRIISEGPMYGTTGMKAAVDAYLTLIRELVDLRQNRVALLTYDDDTRVEVPLTHSLSNLANVAKDIYSCPAGTQIHPALAAASDLFTTDDSRKFILVITDGYFLDDSTQARSLATQLKNQGITIICVGAGDSVDRAMLKRYASPDFVYTIESMSELADTFKTISERIRLKE
ncbi:Hsp70 family protein [Megasphaera elsdenii]|uniref:Hsp70 family protein n=1 Tax=Megasphaera elsdenii TaxID=907 RepID=UPI00266EA0DD|nr:Hsp70 family protein [Megasphaera elsdenii]